MKKTAIVLVIVVMTVLVAAILGGSLYMLDYSLAPDAGRSRVDSLLRRQFRNYPATRAWVDSLRREGALRDTFVTMATGERHHAYYVGRGSNKTAIILHGWRDSGVKFLFLARMYERVFGYNVVVPDLHGHGLSEGDAIQMGWLDRLDAMAWLRTFMTDTMVVHGVSMGGATTMMLSGEEMPEGLKDIRFVDDCGYSSVWEEFAGQLREQFDLSPFPLMYTTSLLCRLRYGWSFGEASALKQVAKCRYPMLFIHGEKDDFVPTEMVYRLYDAKPSPKELWIAPGSGHARSYYDHPADYTATVGRFLGRHFAATFAR